MLVKIRVFRHVTPSRLANIYRRCKGYGAFTFMTRHYKNRHKPYLHTANLRIFYKNEYNQSIFSSSVQKRFAETQYSIIHFFHAPIVNRYLNIYVHCYISVLFCPENTNLTSMVMTRMKVGFHIQCPQSFHFVVICLQGTVTSRV
jgi:Pyruvate/2-oxoacid:ferredoxin oxidoreductase delta subunit